MNMKNNVQPEYFEDFQSFLQARQEEQLFQNQYKEILHNIQQCKNPEEIATHLQHMGFQKLPHIICKHHCCKKLGESWNIALAVYTEMFNHYFFHDMLRRKDHFINGEYNLFHCELPHSWYEKKSLEHRIILWFLQTTQSIIFEAPQPHNQRAEKRMAFFARHVYLLTAFILHQPQERKEIGIYSQKIMHFLETEHYHPKRVYKKQSKQLAKIILQCFEESIKKL